MIGHDYTLHDDRGSVSHPMSDSPLRPALFQHKRYMHALAPTATDVPCRALPW